MQEILEPLRVIYYSAVGRNAHSDEGAPPAGGGRLIARVAAVQRTFHSKSPPAKISGPGTPKRMSPEVLALFPPSSARSLLTSDIFDEHINTKELVRLGRAR